MPSTLMDYDNDKFRKREAEAEKAKRMMGSPLLQKMTPEEAREVLKRMSESGNEIRRDRQMKRNQGLQMTKKSGGIGGSGMLLADADTDTEEYEEWDSGDDAGEVDDDAIERHKKALEEKKRQLEEAAG